MSNVNDGFGPNPNEVPAQKKGGAAKWVIGILVGVVLLGLLCCGAVGVVGYLGLGQIGTQVTEQIQDDPVIVDQIGEVESVSMSIMATGEYQQESGEEGVIVFDIKGSKGSGKLRARQSGSDQFGDYVLVKEGQEYPLSP